MNLNITVILCASILIGLAGAANPSDGESSPVDEGISQATEELQRAALEHIAEGNLTSEHIQQDLNASQEELINRASERLNQSLNVSTEEIQKRAEEELKNQINEKVQQPGFEFVFGLIGIFAVAYLLRRND